jgi:hypothetical protein
MIATKRREENIDEGGPMEPIEFELVSVESLQKSLREEQKLQERQTGQELSAHRSPELPADLRLSEQAASWLAALPESVRPIKLATAYPRIANRLCQCWRRPVEADRYFEDLLTDSRGGRRGFSFEVAQELAVLSDYYRKEVFPVRQTIWDDQYLSDRTPG